MSYSSLNFGLLNIHSVSSVSDILNKPVLLQDFLSEYSLDILSLT